MFAHKHRADWRVLQCWGGGGSIVAVIDAYGHPDRDRINWVIDGFTGVTVQEETY